jgi:hypothetical protein
MLESLQRVFVEGGHEHHPGVALDALRHLEAGQAGHLDVEEGQVGLQLGDAGGGVDAVARQVDDLQFRPQRQQLVAQVVGQVRLIVGDQGAHDAVSMMAGAAASACAGR